MGSMGFGAQVQQVLFDRIPWFWHDRIVAAVSLPPWGLAVLVFLLLYIPSAAFAFLAGVLPEFLKDPSWPVLIGLCAFGAFLAGNVPRAIGRLWASLRPWLANPNEEVSNLEGETRGLLMRPFWGIALIIVAFSVPYFFITPPGAASDPSYSLVYGVLNVALTPFDAYFIAVAASLCTWGISALAWRMSRRLRFKQGFILEGGKAALRPFNALLWMVWGAFALPVIVGTLLIVSTTPAPPGGWMALLNLLSLGIGGALAIPTLILPQLFMSGWLARQKANELAGLRRQLEEAATPPAERDTYQVLWQMQRHQHVAFQIQRVEAFAPTLVDTRFVVQIGTSITAILLANIVLRTALARLL